MASSIRCVAIGISTIGRWRNEQSQDVSYRVHDVGSSYSWYDLVGIATSANKVVIETNTKNTFL